MEKIFSDWLNNSKLSQQEAAEKLDVCQTTIHNWRSGKSKPRLKYMAMIAKLCKVDIGKLMPEDMQIAISAPSIQEESLQMNALDLYKQVFELKDNLIKSKDELIESQKIAHETLATENEVLKAENQVLKLKLEDFQQINGLIGGKQ